MIVYSDKSLEDWEGPRFEFGMEIPPDPRYNELVKRIDYDNSILSVSCSILKHYGCSPKHKTLPAVDRVLKKNPKNVVLILLDGMGAHTLKEILPQKSFLRKNTVEEISSVFPPTTVAATTSVLSGLSPSEHGRLGWYLYYSEVDDNVSVFENIRQETGERLPGQSLADKYMPYESIFTQIEKARPEVKCYDISHFSDFACGTSAQMFEAAEEICKGKNENFIYCYWNNPDKDMHEHGTRSARVKRDLYSLDRQVERFCKSVKNTTVLVIADHGLVDVEWENIREHPKLYSMLTHRPSMERRAVSLFVQPGLEELFATEFRSVFEDKFVLATKDEVLETKLLGEGDSHPMIEEFLGDFLAISTGKWSLEGMRGDCKMAASHAGMTPEEIRVPLIIVEK